MAPTAHPHENRRNYRNEKSNLAFVARSKAELPETMMRKRFKFRIGKIAAGGLTQTLRNFQMIHRNRVVGMAS